MRIVSLLIVLLFFRITIHANLLKNLNLKQAEEIALQSSKPYLISFEDVYQADQRRKQAVSKWLPKITYNGAYVGTPKPMLVIDVPTGGEFFKHNIFINQFELKQPLFSADLYFGLKEKNLELKNSQAEKEDTKNRLLLKVRNDYFSVVLYEAALDIQKENIDYLSQALKVEQGKLNNGDSTTLEVNQSKVAVANSLSEYYATLQKLKDARNSLIYTLGVDPVLEDGLTVADQQIDVFSVEEISEKLQRIQNCYHYPTEDFASTIDLILQSDRVRNVRALTIFQNDELLNFLEIARAKRPDLRSKKLQIDIAQKEVEVKRGEYFPTITGYVDYIRNGGMPQERFASQDPFSWAFGVKLSWNLFDSFLREHKIKEALSKKSASRIDFSYALDNVEIGIRNQLYQIEDSLYIYLSSSEGVLLAEQAMVQAKEKLQYGKIPPLEFRDAVNQLAKSRNLKNMASFQLMLSYYRLRFDLGVDAE